MRNRQHAWLAGVAALALLAGTGWASAQGAGSTTGGSAQLNGKAGGTSHMSQGNSQMRGGQSAGAGQHAQIQGRSQGSLQTSTQNKGGEQGTASNAGRHEHNMSAANGQPRNSQTNGGPGQKQFEAREHNRGQNLRNQNLQNRSAERQEYRGKFTERQEHNGRFGHREENRGTFAEQQGYQRGTTIEQQRRGTMTAQERERGMRGLQANTTMPMQGGGNVRLSERQRETIRNSVIEARGAPRVGHVDFDVRVGTVIPRREIHVVPVPETLVRIEPRWRGYLYFVYEDEVVIVNPRTMQIVAVLEA